MSIRLPGWVVSNTESVRREAEGYRHFTPEQQASVLERVCRAAMDLTLLRKDWEEVLAYREPLPPESRVTWARLRSEARQGRQ